MKTSWAYNKKAYRIFFKHIKRFIGYRLASSLIVTLLLMPVLSRVSKELLSLSGYNYITNNLLSKFLMSPSGMLLILISLLIGFFVVLLEIGGMIVLSHQTILGEKESRFIDILKYTLKRFKYLLSIDGLLMVVYFILIAPLFNNPLSVLILKNIKIPGFILQSINANFLYSILFALVVFSVVFLSIRWMFSLFVLMLDETTHKKILKKSNDIRKGHMKKIVNYLLSAAIFNLAVVLSFSLISLLLISLLLFLLSSFLKISSLILIALLGILFYVFMAITVPVATISLTIFYQELSENKESLAIEVLESKTFISKFLSNKYVTLISFLGVIIIGAGTIYGVIETSENKVYDVEITAHRGSSYQAPENTLAAIAVAYENGADFVEIDVQLTKDGHVILLHDESFKRTTGLNKRPDQLLLEDIKLLDAGLWFSKSFEGEAIPTLKEVMAFSKDKIKINIEIKGSQYSPKVRKAVVDLIEKEDYLKDCVITSLDYEDIITVEQLDSRIVTGYIIFVAFGDLEKLHTDFYSIEASNVSPKFVEEAHRISREVHVWTVNSSKQMKAMMAMGVDNIITDFDEKLKNIIENTSFK